MLRSPAHRLLSGRLLLLTYTGRRSGTQYTIPVQYVRDGEALLVTVGWPERKLWWRNLREPGDARERDARGPAARGGRGAPRDARTPSRCGSTPQPARD